MTGKNSAMTATSPRSVPDAAVLTGDVSTGLRRTDLDSLKIAMCAAVILLHAMMIFAAEPIYHMKSALVSPTASVLSEFLRIVTMAVFFVLAGWAAVVSLRKRGPGRFAHERVTRLLVPLVFGTVLFGSIIKYIELSDGRDIGVRGFRLVAPLQIGFLEFFPENLVRLKLMSWSHLWFLFYLLLMSILLLPLLVRLARVTPRTAVPAALAVYLPALPMAALLAAFNGHWPYLPNFVTDGTNFCYYALCFAMGAGIAAWPGFEKRLYTEAPRLLALMVVAFIGVILCGESTAGRVFVGLTAWCAIGAALGFVARIKPAATPLIEYLSEATLPVYIVHHVFVLLIGIVVLPLGLSVWFTITLIWLSATAISLASYHWLIRPWPPMRWLMGMGSPPAYQSIWARLRAKLPVKEAPASADG
jgi:peptidoglycan/LPS O-acetylase OafA/YrhL